MDYKLILVILAVAILLYCLNYFSTRNLPQKDVALPKEHTAEDCAEGGCGLQQVCNKNKAKEKIIYFEDEELDAYKDKDAADYSDDEIAQFEDVLNTLKPNEVSDWLNSLCARKVTLPEQLRSRAIRMVHAFKDHK